MKYGILFLITIAIIDGCTKAYRNQTDDTGQDGVLRGRLFQHDTLTGNYTDYFPLSKKTITVAYDTGAPSNNYLYSTQTDTAGYFTFNNLLGKHSYRLHYQETLNGIIYAADTAIMEGNQNFVVLSSISDSLNNGIVYIFADSLGGRVPGVNICIFTSSILAAHDTCAGSSFQLPPSDVHGRSYKFNINPGTYYAFITVNYPGFVAKLHDMVTIGASGFQPRVIQLP